MRTGFKRELNSMAQIGADAQIFSGANPNEAGF
jgi:hypothetical protein